ncbi:Dihydroneopterin aldolase [Thermobacillus xylanilyticus]|jgi:dihydroneopterin aldolase|uniref:7,8-dihydroneopterin aldolase n=1 Tax=Thermobacillus xylanilyticus TaxID=76633 RepID=A0ABM8V5S2_THEXY|nr:dihydroneopterin aldolase [Thermobacillus xylanilyticus]REJ14428.1 MAG: dihydroneopterin aldolase [Paenibacillaceae bacterium]CAG5088923.1 Dihydroneopterin aldolase [Thermobacillus xylanilyticus]
MDKMIVRGMRFFGYHGVIPEENRLGQQFMVDVELALELEEAAAADDLAKTVNYADLHARVKRIVEGPPCRLIEALARRIATDLLDTYTNINEVLVRVTKPHPPFDIHFDGVTVELRRKREQHDGQG